MIRARATITTILISVLLGGSGCVSTPLESESPRRLVLQAARGTGDSYPCAVVGVIASTRWHRWQDPCREPFCIYRLASLDMLTKPGEQWRAPPCRPGQGAGPPLFLERHEESSAILFVRGHNPVGLGGYWTEAGRRRNAAYQVGSGGFYRDYYATRDAAPAYDALFVAAEDAAASHVSAGEVVMQLVPLYTPEEGGVRGQPLVNHSMLVFLLNRADLWQDLQVAYRKASQRAAVTVVCQVIDEMAGAHRQRWPDFQWTADQRNVLAWCHQIVAEAAAISPS